MEATPFDGGTKNLVKTGPEKAPKKRLYLRKGRSSTLAPSFQFGTLKGQGSVRGKPEPEYLLGGGGTLQA